MSIPNLIRSYDESDNFKWREAVDYDAAGCDRELVLLLGPAGVGKSHFWRQIRQGEDRSEEKPSGTSGSTSVAGSTSDAISFIGQEQPSDSHVPQGSQSTSSKTSIDWRQFVSLDGDVMRSIHSGYKDLLERQRTIASSATSSPTDKNNTEVVEVVDPTRTESNGTRTNTASFPSPELDLRTISPNQIHETMKPLTAAFRKEIVERGIYEGKNFALFLTFSTSEARDLLRKFSCVRDDDRGDHASGRGYVSGPGYRIRAIVILTSPYSVISQRIDKRSSTEPTSKGGTTSPATTMSRMKFESAYRGVGEIITELASHNGDNTISTSATKENAISTNESDTLHGEDKDMSTFFVQQVDNGTDVWILDSSVGDNGDSNRGDSNGKFLGGKIETSTNGQLGGGQLGGLPILFHSNDVNMRTVSAVDEILESYCSSSS